ncbi:MAG TPA: hypothetical protein VGL40_13705 [Bacillota bacterium]|jgi:hypothetical protein
MDDRRRGLILGGVLILIGALTFLSRFFRADLGEITGGAFLWLIAAGFFVAYSNRRQLGFLIAGSMVAAVGTFTLLQAWRLPGVQSGGLFFVLIGLAFFFVYAIGTKPNPWPIFPGLATIAFGVVVFGLETPGLRLIALPVILIGLGLWMVFRPRFW